MTADAAPLLQAPADWRRVDFIADLHLQGDDSATFLAWRNFMQSTAADAVFILGDLFEVWVGDDVLQAGTVPGLAADAERGPDLAARCAQVIESAGRRLSVYFMHGNRDFLLGQVFAQACGMSLLADPTALDFAGRRWLLSHGDALCLQDTDYMEFRAKVRSAPWREAFLAKPMTERQRIGRELRAQSEARKKTDRSNAALPVDLDTQATRSWLQAAGADTLIHGHTHKPAEHDLGNGLRRIVLSDWDATASPARGSVLRLNASVPDQTQRAACVERLAAGSASTLTSSIWDGSRNSSA